jgi:small-conductance mechanosensitive channel
MIKQHITYRLLWAGGALAFASISFTEFVNTANYGSAFITVGWILFAAAWFMLPVVPATSFRKMLTSSNQHAIGPVGLRTFATFAGLACLLVGLILKFSL